jgi:indolepyruvate ferredoxin oxidoreductase
MLRNFRLLAKLKRLRGTPLDLFGYTAERKAERALIKQYERDIDTAMAGQPGPLATALLNLPDSIRGFGPVKEEAMKDAEIRRADILARMKGGTAPEEAKMAAE